MVAHELIPDDESLNVRIYDAPANGARMLFTERDKLIAKYANESDARAGVGIYDRADKEALLSAELSVYVDAARTGKALGQCGLPSLARLTEGDRLVYVAFTLPKNFVIKSRLQIIAFDGDQTIYSLGWDTHA